MAEDEAVDSGGWITVELAAGARAEPCFATVGAVVAVPLASLAAGVVPFV